MKVITLKRICSTDAGTFGVMIMEEIIPFPFCLSLELPWRDNKTDESCIPTGEYICKRIQSPHFGEVFQVQNVPNRTDILIHKANWTTDLLGCIGIGEQFEETINPTNGKVCTSIMASNNAFLEFMNVRLAGEQEFKLVILAS